MVDAMNIYACLFLTGGLMAECYTATIKALKRSARDELIRAQRCYDFLSNKDTEYAKDVLAILEIKKQVAAIYENAPHET